MPTCYLQDSCTLAEVLNCWVYYKGVTAIISIKSKKRYSVAHLGLGPRGHIHIQSFLDNPDRFEVMAICDLDREKLDDASEKYGIKPLYTDSRKMLREVKPDIFCFVTPVTIRQEMVELAAGEGIKAIAFEKPIALSIREAHNIKRIIEDNGIKSVVSHQLKYLASMQKLKQILESGALGDITYAHATTVPWFMQLGTHFMDYMMWANGGHPALWAVGHVHGRHHLLAEDGHFGTDYLFGEFLLENGVRGILECGYLSPSHLPKSQYWIDDRLTFYGTEGFAWADNANRWNLVTSRESGLQQCADEKGRDVQERTMQAIYMREYANWLDDDNVLHPCRYAMAFQGYEVLQAIQKSALEHRRVDLPLNPAEFYDMNDRMLKELPEVADCSEWLNHGDAPVIR